MRNLFLLPLHFLFLSISCFAEIRLPKIIGDNMVLQQNQEIKIWGWADKGEKVSIQFNGQSKSTKADKNGKWEFLLSPMEHGGPLDMTLTGKNKIEIKNILIGEVWLCGGQSNMEWPMTLTNNSEEEIANANQNEIRIFHVPHVIQFKPANDIPEGEWKIVTPENIANFSAVGYFFGKNIHEKFGFPVGLISSNWGGTDIETWMSKDAISSVTGFEKTLSELSLVDEQKIKSEQEEKRKNIQKLITSETDGIVNGKALWAEKNYDDSNWKSMNIPELWETGPLPDVDGIVWFRKTIELTKEQIKGDATLYLGLIDDSDISYVNGEVVGKTEQQYNSLRKYKVPAYLLKEGKNVITVRVHDTGGGGGIWGDEKFLKLETSDKKILSLSGAWKFQISPQEFRMSNSSFNPNKFPTLLYNGMIHPIKNYSMQGVIWYQGENNAWRAKTYQTLFPLMINDWRKQLNNPDLAFLFVQLANFMELKDIPGESAWAELREAQTKTLNLNKVAMTVAIDIGDAKDIHPRNKQDVGYRLALGARKLVYNEEIVYSGPIYKSMKITGDSIRIEFNHTGSGLITQNKYGYVMGFEVAGEDKKFHWAKAWIEGNNVIVYSPMVDKPVAVRYAWADNPEDANLYNKDGLPASPFRTDDWPGITK